MPEREPLVHCGRTIEAVEIRNIETVLGQCSGLSRTELVRTICEHLKWFTPAGKYKLSACATFLERLEAQGAVHLPARRVYQAATKSKGTRWEEWTAEQPAISGELLSVAPVRLEVVTEDPEKSRWNEYVDRYHYLGYQKPFGYRLRYFIMSPRGLLGCVLLAGAARAIAARDKWIGWTVQQRRNNLPWVVSNTRFLLFPWVQVRHLASHVLGQVARRVRQDWHERWGFRPALLETFVDPSRYQGTCYQAAGWMSLGQTSGRGLARPGLRYETTPKTIYVRPLAQDFRRQLCSNNLLTRQQDE